MIVLLSANLSVILVVYNIILMMTVRIVSVSIIINYYDADDFDQLLNDSMSLCPKHTLSTLG